MILKQIAILLALSLVLGLGVNQVSPNQIAFVGLYRTVATGDEPVTLPETMAGDPPFITLEDAMVEFNARSALFVDAREPEEFACGTIPGAVNVPFDLLPGEGMAAYFDSALAGAAADRPLVTFCSGDECDASLHLARNLQAEGYTAISIFFGGSREWKKAGLPMERSRQCEE